MVPAINFAHFDLAGREQRWRGQPASMSKPEESSFRRSKAGPYGKEPRTLLG